MPTLTLANAKGGSGKSTLAACLAAELHQRGHQVKLLDADPQGTLTRWHSNGGPLGALTLHADATEAAAAWAKREGRNGIVIADCAGAATRTLAAILASADVVLIPCRASPLDAEVALRTAAILEERRRREVAVGVVLNACGHSTLVAHIDRELTAAGLSVMRTRISQRVAFAEAQLHGSAPCWMGTAAHKAAAEIAALTSELLDFLTPGP